VSTIVWTDGVRHKVVSIDQSPIGRNSRSNPATYIGFYDNIRDLFTQAPLSVSEIQGGPLQLQRQGRSLRGMSGRGFDHDGDVLHADVEVTCGACKGALQQRDARVTVRGKTIDDVLNMSFEEGVGFFAAEQPSVARFEVLNELGLGYLTLGQSSTTLSVARHSVKIAAELSKLQMSKHTVYILDNRPTGLHLADRVWVCSSH
jgi:excinuclease ABC subunit A